MATNIVIQEQALQRVKSTQWNTGIFDMCDDMRICCYSFWCFPCFQCTTAKKFGESALLPCFDWMSAGIVALAGFPLCIPPISLALRVAVRHKYGIEGNICSDCPAATFCIWCSWTQISREIDIRNQPTIAVTTQPIATAIQPVDLVSQPGHILPQPGFVPPPPEKITPPPL